MSLADSWSSCLYAGRQLSSHQLPVGGTSHLTAVREEPVELSEAVKASVIAITRDGHLEQPLMGFACM